MWSQFLFENAHFAINLFMGLVLFAVFWLYLDAWKGSGDKGRRGFGVLGVRVMGFILLSFSFVIHAVFLETSLLSSSVINADLAVQATLILRISGYALVLISAISERLQSKPGSAQQSVAVGVLPFAITSVVALHLLQPILAFLVTIFYLRRATVGLERHLKPVTAAFAILTVAELLSLASLWRQSDNVEIFNLVAPLGPIWVLEHIIFLIASLVLGKWVFGYLLKQFQTQLFMIFSSVVLVIFLITTVAFTGLLLKNIQDESVRQLESDVRVLEFALDSRRAESVADAQVIAQNPEIQGALQAGDRGKLASLSEQFLLSKKHSFLVIVDDHGQIVARGEDKEKIGGSLSDDILIKRSLLGEAGSTAAAKEGVISPEVSLRGASPIKNGNTILGAVMLGTVVDNAFVDGIKKATGLEASIYGDNVLSSTTLVSTDGKTRLVGIKEENQTIKQKVLVEAQSHSGSLTIANTPYFAAHLPLKDIDGNPVGMLFVGRAQIGVLQTAGRSIELTFIVTAIMLVLSIIPSYLISRYLAKQI